MSGCEMEMCRHWTGEGCACRVFDLPPAPTTKDGE
jgi:hypothetical protein